MSARWGDSTMTSCVDPAQAGQRRRNSPPSSGSFVTCTAMASDDSEFANAMAWRAARSRRATGTMTIGSGASSAPSGIRSIARSASTDR